jgi:hypothetical protein
MTAAHKHDWQPLPHRARYRCKWPCGVIGFRRGRGPITPYKCTHGACGEPAVQRLVDPRQGAQPRCPAHQNPLAPGEVNFDDLSDSY